MSSKKPKVPVPSRAEQELQLAQKELIDQQRELLDEQRRLERLLEPQLFEQLGLEAIRDDEGNITGFQPSELGAARTSIEKQLLERTQKALRGELDISPTLERELGERKETETERLRRQLGPGFETTTTGAEALTDLSQSDIEIREAVRRGELSLSESLSLARGGATTETVLQAPQIGRETFGARANLISQFNAPLQRFLSERGLQGQLSGQPSSLERILAAGAGGAAAFGLSKVF